MNGVATNTLFKKRAFLVLFFFSLILPLVSDNFSFDAHYSVGWVLLSVITVGLLFLLPIQFTKWFVGSLILLFVWKLSDLRGYHTDWSVWAHFELIVILFSINWNSVQEWMKLPSILALITTGGILIYLLIRNYVDLGYSHQITYEVAPFYAHRNIALEHFSILSLLVLFQTEKSRLVWLWIIPVLAILFLFQARAALLTFIAGVFIWLYQVEDFRKWILLLFSVGLSYLMITYVWSSVNFESYRLWIEWLPDLAKSIDPIYNMNYMPSSSERIHIWQWTWNQLSFLPHGLGQWKILSQGWIVLPNYDCLTIVRRPHNDLLLMMYEMGWIGGMLFVLFLIWSKPTKLWLALLPIFLFSFPLERAGLIIPIVAFVCYKTDSVFRLKPSFIGLRKFLLSATVLGLLLIHLARWRADFIYQNFVMDIERVGSLSALDNKVIQLFEYDFLLNHFDKYSAFYAIKSGEMEKAKDLAWENYNRNSNFYGNYVLLKGLLKDVDGQQVESTVKYPCEREE